MRGWLIVFGLGVGAFAEHSTAAASDKLIAYGRHLSQECSSCHRLDGADHNGIPSLIGHGVEEFIETLGYYKSGMRTNEVMVSVARSLDDEQMKALAHYFSSLTNAKPAATPAKSTSKR